MKIDLTKLAAPFPADQIEWRVGQVSKGGDRATLLSYVTARAVMDRLDEVCGPENWQDAYTPVTLGPKAAGFLCTLSIRTADGWVSKSDVSDTSDIEALKGACSGALKRAAVKWGISRYLYDLEGKGYLPIKAGYPPDGSGAIFAKLGDGPGHIFPPKLPEWALPPKTTDRVAGSGQASATTVGTLVSASTASNTPPEKAPALTTQPPEKPAKETPEEKASGSLPAAARRAPETEEEKAARQAQHDPSWAQDQKRFMARIAELGFGYEELCEFCEWVPMKRPSHLSQKARNSLLERLSTVEGADRFATFLDYKAGVSKAELPS